MDVSRNIQANGEIRIRSVFFASIIMKIIGDKEAKLGSSSNKVTADRGL